MESPLFQKLQSYIENIEVDTIPIQRKAELQPLIEFICTKMMNGQEVRSTFICTHNSRRSHLSQVWFQTLACHFGLKKVFSYSAGTEKSAVYPMVIETLKKTGFEIETLAESDNPVYSIKYANNEHPIISFSKEIDDNFNPKTGFAAVMTCSQADGDCPYVAGAEMRIPIPFDDPKVYDDSPQQSDIYLERSMQIATELFYVFSQIKSGYYH